MSDGPTRRTAHGFEILDTTVTRQELIEAMKATLAWIEEDPARAAQVYSANVYGGVSGIPGISSTSGGGYTPYAPADAEDPR